MTPPAFVQRIPWGGRIWRFGADFAHEWTKDRVGGLAAEIAFFAILGLFPALIVVAAALGSSEGLLGAETAADVEDWIVDQIDRIFGSDSSLEEPIRDLFAGPNRSAFTIGAVLAVYAASRGFVAVVRALDVAYDHEHRRSWISTRLVGLALTFVSVLAGTALLVLIVVGPQFGTGEELAVDLGLDSAFATLWDWLRVPVIAAVMVAWASVIYHVAPNHRSPWRHELPGAVLATVWWLVVSLGFSTYLDLASSGANAVFGVLGGALSLLFWLYLMAIGLLVGAEINSMISVRRGIDLTRAPGDDVVSRLRRRRKGPG